MEETSEKNPGGKQRLVNATTRALSSGNICSFVSLSLPLEGNFMFNGIGSSITQKKRKWLLLITS